MSKTLEVYSKEVEKINTRMYRRRINQNGNYKQWKMLSHWDYKPMQPREKIKELLNKGYKVTAGYMATAIRGAHSYYIMYK